MTLLLKFQLTWTFYISFRKENLTANGFGFCFVDFETAFFQKPSPGVVLQKNRSKKFFQSSQKHSYFSFDEKWLQWDAFLLITLEQRFYGKMWRAASIFLTSSFSRHPNDHFVDVICNIWNFHGALHENSFKREENLWQGSMVSSKFNRIFIE